MYIFWIMDIPILALLFLALGTIGALGNLLSTFIVILSFMLTGINIVFSLYFLFDGPVAINQILISRITRILLGIFFIFFPIMLFVFLLISGKFLDVNYIHILDHSISNIYQNPKGFLFASLIGYGINFIFMIIIRLADWLENTLSIVIDCLIIFLIFLLLYNGKIKQLKAG